MGRSASVKPVTTCLAVTAGFFVLLALSPATSPVFAQTPSSVEGLRCFSTVMSRVPETLARVSGSSEPGRQSFAAGETVYLDIGAGENLSIGTSYTLYRIEGEISHPTTSESVGSAVKMLGTIEIVDRAGLRLLARVEQACDVVEVGDRLQPLLPALPTGDNSERTEREEQLLIADPADATIVYGSSETIYDPGSDTGRTDMSVRQSYSPSEVVTVDLGSASGWQIGATVLFYSMAGTDRGDVYGGQQEALELGRGRVVWAQEDTAAVLVTESIDAIRLGHRARRLR